MACRTKVDCSKTTVCSYILQKGITKSATNDRVTSTDGIAGAYFIKAGVDLNKVERNERAGLCNALGDEVSLTKRQTTSDGGTGAGGPHGVEGVDIEGQVDGCIAADPGQRHVHDLANAMPM